jgi:hypothetical protein
MLPTRADGHEILSRFHVRQPKLGQTYAAHLFREGAEEGAGGVVG